MDMNGFFYQVDQLLMEKKIDEAEKYMKDSLAQAEEECDAGAIISICNELGGLYRALSRYDEGIPLYEKALQCIHDLGLDGTEHHGTTLVNYATTYTMMGDVPKALELDTEAAGIFSSAGFAMDYRLATLYNNMSFLCMDLGHYEEAETSLNDALYILKALDDSEIDVAVTYSNLANVYLAMDRLEEAKVTVKKALDLFIAESGDTDVHYAGAVSTLGAIYFREENWEKAAALMETALKLNARDYGEENQSYAILSSNLADCLEKMDRKAEAEEYRRKAASIMERIGL